MSVRRGFVGGAVTSLVMHLGLAVWISKAPAEKPYERPDALAWHELPGRVAEAALDPSEQRTPAELVLGGPRSEQNVDGPHDGQGGDDGGSTDVTFLVSRVHDVWLQDSPLTATTRSQTQRIRTSRDRASWENRRATPNPADAPFLASGSGTHRQRRPTSERDATLGSVQTVLAATVGDREARRLLGFGEASNLSQEDSAGGGGQTVQDSRPGQAEDSPAQGIAAGVGQRRSERARVAHDRPPVDLGPAATLAQTQARVQDNRDAELLAAQLVQSTVAASRRSGSGDGLGGSNGPGAPGEGDDAREGGRAHALMPGGGRGGLDTRDARYQTWYLRARRRVEDRLVFPRERMIRMDQGLAVYRLYVRRSGQLRGAPARVRSSGFPDMDSAAVEAILASTPFDAIPAEIAPGQDVVRIDLTVEFANPMVH